MTAPTVTHRPWCHPAQCHTIPGEQVIHRHLIGVVAGVEVTVEQRVDPARPRCINPAEVHVRADGSTGLTAVETDELHVLLSVARLFAGEVS